jgi:hypothetical protein
MLNSMNETRVTMVLTSWGTNPSTNRVAWHSIRIRGRLINRSLVPIRQNIDGTLNYKTTIGIGQEQIPNGKSETSRV